MRFIHTAAIPIITRPMTIANRPPDDSSSSCGSAGFPNELSEEDDERDGQQNRCRIPAFG